MGIWEPRSLDVKDRSWRDVCEIYIVYCFLIPLFIIFYLASTAPCVLLPPLSLLPNQRMQKQRVSVAGSFLAGTDFISLTLNSILATAPMRSAISSGSSESWSSYDANLSLLVVILRPFDDLLDCMRESRFEV